MTKLSFIETEARRVMGNLSEQALRTLQGSLVELCEVHWCVIRGPQPTTSLANTLWAIRPHLVDLLVDLYGAADPKLLEALDHVPFTKAIAGLVLAEIERGDAEGARLAYETMMLFESPQARQAHLQAVRSRLYGTKPKTGKWHKHMHRDAFFQAMAVISEQTGRRDLQAMTAAVKLLAETQSSPNAMGKDKDLEQILIALRDMGLAFQGIDGDRIHYTLRGVERTPITSKRLEDILAQLRGNP
ncbi:MAG TPA: hypothetical protein VLU73_17340 [Methylococcaceae bacterium]|jgi:hypothetical protein|nr:hypothetical protein [Methylococcaceae bacterium]